MRSVLAVNGVTKRYGDHVALSDVDLSVSAGEILALLGANGAGKSTLLSLVGGLRRPDAGTVAIGPDGGNPRTPAVRKKIGFAPQELGIYPRLSVADNVKVFAEMAGLRGNACAQRIEETAAGLGITKLLGQRAGELSGGERRRVHVAMALVHRPALVILDEPTAGVDVAARDGLVDLVRALAADGAAVVYSTHYLAEAEAFGGRVAVLHRGRKVADNRVPQLIEGLPGYVELTFDGPVPELGLRSVEPPRVDGSVARFISSDPEHDAAAILAEAGPYLRSIRSISVHSAGLDDAYRAITGEAMAETDA